ncbi:uncharacterized protein LY79DRAFT_563371 [Colletotrichum navitas]|uniref:Uncharacterized protein n=1 Tax=Colletotrichum navitas TaxID=681940 RepID=A0AAD8PTI5_9PEZI|nr:uncharacterized protein LY79DRAFT_563371 [Colletotrichum navitas]KAK1579763.1 hypothetical protein LY79DRAFT_563371 [Colletotrichum navitas]
MMAEITRLFDDDEAKRAKSQMGYWGCLTSEQPAVSQASTRPPTPLKLKKHIERKGGGSRRMIMTGSRSDSGER